MERWDTVSRWKEEFLLRQKRDRTGFWKVWWTLDWRPRRWGTESYLGFRFQEGGWGTLVEKLFLLGTAPTRAVSESTHICACRGLRVAGQLGDLII